MKESRIVGGHDTDFGRVKMTTDNPFEHVSKDGYGTHEGDPHCRKYYQLLGQRYIKKLGTFSNIEDPHCRKYYQLWRLCVLVGHTFSISLRMCYSLSSLYPSVLSLSHTGTHFLPPSLPTVLCFDILACWTFDVSVKHFSSASSSDICTPPSLSAERTAIRTRDQRIKYG